MDASVISLNNNTSQYYFAGSPIIVTVSVPSGNTAPFPNGSALRRVHVVVESTFGNKTFSATFPRECDNGEEFEEDISSAIRAVLSNRIVSPYANVQAQQDVSFTVGAYASWLLDGEEQTDMPADPANLSKTNARHAVAGAFTELELFDLPCNRIQYSGGYFALSTKPTGFIYSAPPGYVVRMPYMKNNNIYEQRSTLPSPLAGLDRIVTVTAGNKNYKYHVEYMEAYSFVFLNRRGQLEDACCRTLESLSHNVDKKEYNMVGSPSETPVQSLLAHRPETRRIYAMSSGYCSQEMVEWWITEFLTSEKYWMKMGNAWIPVSVTTSNKKVTEYDKANPSALAVNFTVTLGLKG